MPGLLNLPPGLLSVPEADLERVNRRLRATGELTAPLKPPDPFGFVTDTSMDSGIQQFKTVGQLGREAGDAALGLGPENIAGGGRGVGLFRFPGTSLLREPTASELNFFKKNPSVSGMAAKDNRVILKPFSNLSKKEMNSVLMNESARIAIRTGLVRKPTFQITPEQAELFSTINRGVAYGSDDDIRATIAARILSGDPSVLNPTEEQRKYVDSLRSFFSDGGARAIRKALGVSQ